MFTNSSNVIVLDDESFNYKDNGKVYLKNKGFNGILLAYAEWCPHCKSKEITAESIGNVLNNKSKNDRMYVIDADQNSQFGRAIGLFHFPMFFRIHKSGLVHRVPLGYKRVNGQIKQDPEHPFVLDNKYNELQNMVN